MQCLAHCPTLVNAALVHHATEARFEDKECCFCLVMQHIYQSRFIRPEAIWQQLKKISFDSMLPGVQQDANEYL
jgi:hypothetical protein